MSTRAKPGAASRSGGSAERGAGTRLRDATVEPIVRASFKADPMRVSGVTSPEGPLFRPTTRASKHNTLGTCSALRVIGRDTHLESCCVQVKRKGGSP